MVGEVPSLVEDHQLAVGERDAGQPGVAERDDGVAPTPHDERRHVVGQVGAVEHGDDLALPIDARAQRAQDGAPRFGVGEGVEHGEDLLGVAPERRVEKAEDAGAEPAEQLDRREPQQRHQRLGTGHGGHTQQRAHGASQAPTAHQDQPLAALGKLVGELRRDAAAERVADDGGAVHLQDGEQVAHAVGVAAHGVVGSRFLGPSVAEQVRRNDGVVLGQLLEHGSPGVGAVADAVDEEDGRPTARLDVGPTVPVHRHVLHLERALPPDPGAEADFVGVDGMRRVNVRGVGVGFGLGVGPGVGAGPGPGAGLGVCRPVVCDDLGQARRSLARVGPVHRVVHPSSRPALSAPPSSAHGREPR